MEKQYSRIEKHNREKMIKNYRMWKKGKTWLFTGSALTMLLGGAIISTASSVEAASYTIKPGDTLWGIAENHKIRLNTLEEANQNIANYDLIFPNQVVEIPTDKGFSNTDYIVKLGDSLWKIATENGMTLSELFSLNPQYDMDHSFIYPGDIIKITISDRKKIDNQVKQDNQVTQVSPVSVPNGSGITSSHPVTSPEISPRNPATNPGTTPNNPATDPGTTPSHPATDPGTTPNNPATDPGTTPSHPGTDANSETVKAKDKLKSEAEVINASAITIRNQADEALSTATNAQEQAQLAFNSAQKQAQIANEAANQAQAIAQVKDTAKTAAEQATLAAQAANTEAMNQGLQATIQSSKAALSAAQAAQIEVETASIHAQDAAVAAIIAFQDAKVTVQETQTYVNKANIAKAIAEEKAMAATTAATAAQTALKAAQDALAEATKYAESATKHKTEAQVVAQQIGTEAVSLYQDEAGNKIGDGTKDPGSAYRQVGTPTITSTKKEVTTGVQGQYVLVTTTTYTMHKIMASEATVNVDEAGNVITPTDEYKLVSTVKGEPVAQENGDTLTTTTNTYHKIQHVTINIDESGVTITPSDAYKLVSTSNPVIAANGDVSTTITYHKIQHTKGDSQTINLDENNKVITSTTGMVVLYTKVVDHVETLPNGDTITTSVSKTVWHVPSDLTIVKNITENGTVIGESVSSDDYKFVSTNTESKTTKGDTITTITNTYHKIVKTTKAESVNIDEAGNVITPSRDYKLVSSIDAKPIVTTAENGDTTTVITTTNTYHKIVKTTKAESVNIDEAGNVITPSNDYKLVSSIAGAPVSVTLANGDIVSTVTTTNTYHKIVKTTKAESVNIDEAGKTITPSNDYKLVSSVDGKPVLVTLANGDIVSTVTTTNTYHKMQKITGTDKTVNVLDNTNQEITDITGLTNMGKKTTKVTETKDNGDIVVYNKTTITYHKPVQIGSDIIVNNVNGNTVTESIDTDKFNLLKETNEHTNIQANGDYSVTTTRFYETKPLTIEEFKNYIAVNITKALNQQRQRIITSIPGLKQSLIDYGIDPDASITDMSAEEQASGNGDAQAAADEAAENDILAHSNYGDLAQNISKLGSIGVNNFTKAMANEVINRIVDMNWNEFEALKSTIVDGNLPVSNHANGHLNNVLMASKIYTGVAVSIRGNVYVASNFS